MTTLLTVFLLIDVSAAMYLFRQGFLLRSNMNRKYKIRFIVLAAIIASSVLSFGISPMLACFMAGIPASLMALFAIYLLGALLLHKGPWG